MFSEPQNQVEVDEIFETFKEPLDKTLKIDVIIEHYLSLVSQLKSDLKQLREDITQHKKFSDESSDPLQDYQSIQKFSALLSRELTIPQIALRLDEISRDLFSYQSSELFLQEDDTWISASKKPNSDFHLIVKCAQEEGIIKWLWEQAHPIVAPLSDFMIYDQLKKKKGNVIMIPLLEGEQGIGVYILVTEKGKSNFTIRDLELLNVLGKMAALFIQYSRLYQDFSRRETQISQINTRLMSLSRLATLGELSAGIAHEINNPLQIIMGNVQMARMGHRLEESLEIIEKQSVRIANIVRGLLNMTRKNHQSMVEYLEINPLIVNTLNLVRGQIEKRNIDIKLELDKNLPVIQCGAIYFQQILLNFLLHAKLQIGQNGNIFIHSRSADRDWLEVEIQDSGVPIPAEYIDKVMDPFSRIENAGEINLGLTVSVQMVQDLGGEVIMKSDKQNGNSIIMKIPSYSSKQKTDQQKVASLG